MKTPTYASHPGESRDLRPQSQAPSFWPEIPAFAGITAVLVLCTSLTACGVQRPLLRPAEVPAYEEKQRKKREAMIEEQQQLKALDEQRATEKANETQAQ